MPYSTVTFFHSGEAQVVSGYWGGEGGGGGGGQVISGGGASCIRGRGGCGLRGAHVMFVAWGVWAPTT